MKRNGMNMLVRRYGALRFATVTALILGPGFSGTVVRGDVRQAERRGVLPDGGVAAGGNPACGPGAGDCSQPNGTPGCDNVDCCNMVCAIDPFCCDVEWDQPCADQSIEFPECAAGECIVDADCDDGNACTDDICLDGVCIQVPAADGTACDDGDLCTASDSCIGGVCAGEFTDCDDGNVCTDDFCGGGGPETCLHSFNMVSCDDGDPCTTDDACNFGLCVGVPGDCGGGNECETCLALALGTVVGTTLDNDGSTGDDTTCADNDTIDEWYCYTATCSGTATLSTCNQADFDTTLAVFTGCDGAEVGCNDDGPGCAGFTSLLTFPITAGETVNVRVSGWNGDAGNYTLTLSEDCDPAGCVTDADCDDGNACTLDTCDEASGNCVHVPAYNELTECCDPAGGVVTPIDDGNECTDDVCNPDGSVDHIPVAGGVACGDLTANDCDNPDTCDGAGICVSNLAAAGTVCGQSDPCTTDDVCDGEGICVSGVPLGSCVQVQEGKPDKSTGQLQLQQGGAARPAAPVQAAPAAETDPVYLFSGECYESVVDLRISGRGIDFAWERKYRSRIGPNTVQGNGWDFAYNIKIQATGDDIIVHDGNTRRDTYALQGNGIWTHDLFFQELEKNPDDSYTLHFANTAVWNFHPLDGNPQAGKISSIADRNGNALSFDYDSLGRLVTVHDTLDTATDNRDITIAYNADGFIESVTDFIGRFVTYEYYDGIEADGGFGDLKSVTSPVVVGTPNGNDFLSGKTTVYTYSTGFADERLNHNLLTITDPKGQTYLINTYAVTQDANDLNFDRVMHQVWGYPGDHMDFVYREQTPISANNFATTKTMVNDRMGNVSEYFYDADNRLVIAREYTGRANPDMPTDLDSNTNPPINPLRPGDPPFFEERYEWNDNSLVTRIVHANLNEELFTYDPANPSQRSRSNLLQRCTIPGPLAGDQTQICEYFEYDPIINYDTNFVTREVDGRGAETLHEYDAAGNHTHTQHRIASIVEDFEYNAYGQVTAHVLPDNGSPGGHRRRDEFTYYGSGSQQMGYLYQVKVDVDNLVLITSYEFDNVGNIVRVTDPRGHDIQFIVNELDQVVRRISREVTDGSGVRYERDTFYDANDNVVRVDVQNIDDNGVLQPNTHFTTVYEYEILNFMTSVCVESGAFTGAIPGPPELPSCTGLPASEFITNEFEFDENRNRVLVRYGEAVNGYQPANIERIVFDERDLVFHMIQAEGDPDQSTTQADYDNNKNITRISQGTEDSPRVTTYAYDGYDRLVTSVDPMGNTTEYHYDANHNRVYVREDGEMIDDPGSTGNVRLSEVAFEFDAMDRLTRAEQAFFDPDTQTDIGDGLSVTEIIFSDNSQIIRVVNDNGHETAFAYDTANRRSVITDAMGNEVRFEEADGSPGYDANSNVVAVTGIDLSDLGNPDEAFTTTFAYDNLDRIVQAIDNVGNLNRYLYDSRDNEVVTLDALDNETRFVYDGLDRLTATIRDLDGDGADGDGSDITTTQVWDDTSRLTVRTDDSGNATRSAYDALNRIIVTQMADGTFHQVGEGAQWALGFDMPDLTGFQTGYDVHDNILRTTDANASYVVATHDLLDRVIDRNVVPGPGVSSDINFENFQWDGVSRLVYAEDDDSIVTRSFDSLSGVVSETLNGKISTSVFDGVGNQLGCSYPGGRSISVTFDELERMSIISDQSGLLATYDFVGPARVQRREFGNGTRTDFTFDGITGILNETDDFGVQQIVRTAHTKISDGTVLDDRTYKWDPMGNKIQRKDIRVGGRQRTHNYTYDRIYRLIHTTALDDVSAVIRNTDYDLDGVGNRTTVLGTPDPGSHVGPYTMDPTLPEPADLQMNQYTTTPVDGHLYDKNGNLISMAAFTCPSSDAPLGEDSLNTACAVDADCTNLAVCVQGECYVPKNKHISLRPGNAGNMVALRVTMTASGLFPAMIGESWWVQAHAASDPPELFRLDCTPHFQDWSQSPGTIHVADMHITTQATYQVQAIATGCDVADPGSYSSPVNLPTVQLFGDCVGPFAGVYSPPNGSVNLEDVFAAVQAFQGLPSAPNIEWVDVDGDVPNATVNLGDAFAIVIAFQNGGDYPYSGPSACPPGPFPEAGPPPPATTIAYDYRNQMVEFVDGDSGQRHTYAYDALGRRIAKIVDADGLAGGPTATRFFYDGWHVTEEQDATGTTQTTYVYGRYVDEVLTMQRLESDFYFHADDLGSIMALTDAAGSVVERYDYQDYGDPEFMDPDSNPLVVQASAVGNPYLFTGRRFDPETGWYYFRTRYLDPVAGRFTTRDTIGIWGDLANLGNGYTYVGNNPASTLDPYGLAPDERSAKDKYKEAVEALEKALLKNQTLGNFNLERKRKAAETAMKEAGQSATAQEKRAWRQAVRDKFYKEIRKEGDALKGEQRDAWDEAQKDSEYLQAKFDVETKRHNKSIMRLKAKLTKARKKLSDADEENNADDIKEHEDEVGKLLKDIEKATKRNTREKADIKDSDPMDALEKRAALGALRKDLDKAKKVENKKKE